MKISILTPHESGAESSDSLRAAFRLRHKVFNGELGWGLANTEGMETDRYDSLAHHVLAHDEAGQLVGYWRLCATTAPYLTGDVFGDLFDDEIPQAPEIWELSRFCVDNDALEHKLQRRNRAVAAMAAAIQEFCILNGIATLLSVQDEHITKAARLFYGDPTWQTKTLSYGVTTATCYAYMPSLEKLYFLRTRYALAAPVLQKLVRAAA